MQLIFIAGNSAGRINCRSSLIGSRLKSRSLEEIFRSYSPIGLYLDLNGIYQSSHAASLSYIKMFRVYSKIGKQAEAAWRLPLSGRAPSLRKERRGPSICGGRCGQTNAPLPVRGFHRASVHIGVTWLRVSRRKSRYFKRDAWRIARSSPAAERGAKGRHPALARRQFLPADPSRIFHILLPPRPAPSFSATTLPNVRRESVLEPRGSRRFFTFAKFPRRRESPPLPFLPLVVL